MHLVPPAGARVWAGLGFGSGFRVSGFGFGFRVRVQFSGSGFGFGFGFRVRVWFRFAGSGFGVGFVFEFKVRVWVRVWGLMLWFCPMAVRCTQMNSVAGGWSRILAFLLHDMFLGVHGFSTAGIAFTYGGRDYLVFAKLANLLSDGDGLRKAIGWRGGASLRPSFIHGNILKKNSDLAGRAPGFVEISCSDDTQLHKTTLQEFQDSCDFVAEAFNRFTHGIITKTLFLNIQKSEGQNYVPGGIAFDQRLRGLWFETVTVDWVHTFLQDGVFTVEAMLRIQAGEDPEALRLFLQLPWQFPASMLCKGNMLWRIFSECRLDDGDVDKVRASASELLGLYSLLRHYLATEGSDMPELDPRQQSFEACCEIIDLIILAKRNLVSPRDAASLLKQRISSFLELHICAYGEEHLKPKHCWMWAIVEHWLRDDWVFDAFIVERLHLQVKACGHRLRSLKRYERSLLSGIVNMQINCLQTLNGPVCLIDTPVACEEIPGAMLADSMQVYGVTMKVDDIAFHQQAACKVVACMQIGGFLFAIVEVFTPIVVVTPYCKRWQTDTEEFKRIPAEEMHQAPRV